MSLNFFLYEAIKQLFVEDPTKPSMFEKFACGSTAGAIASTVVYPLNSVGARLAVAAPGAYSGMIDCFRQTLGEGEGIKPFYKGYSANLPRIVVSRGGEMLIFNSLIERFVPQGEAATTLQGLFFGGAASLVMSSITYPLLLARTKLQTQGMARKPVMYTNFVDVIRKTVSGDAALGIKAGGVGALFNGLSACLMKFVPATAIQFTIYNQVVNFL